VKRIAFAALAMVAMLASPLWSQQDSEPEFVDALRERLAVEGWSAAELRELAGQEVDWSQARLRDAEAVAVCLNYARQEDGKIGPEARAQIAMQLAASFEEMRSFGFGEPAILRAGLNGVRELLGELHTWRAGEDNESGLGDLLHSRLRQQLHSATCLEAQEQIKNQDRDRNRAHSDQLVGPGPRAGEGVSGGGSKGL
jgi:hypothetical protein